MSSDDSIVATTTDFAPTVVGETDRDRSVVSSASAHDGTSQPRPGVQQTQLNVLNTVIHETGCGTGTEICAVLCLLWPHVRVHVWVWV